MPAVVVRTIRKVLHYIGQTDSLVKERLVKVWIYKGHSAEPWPFQAGMRRLFISKHPNQAPKNGE